MGQLGASTVLHNSNLWRSFNLKTPLMCICRRWALRWTWGRPRLLDVWRRRVSAPQE